MLNNKKGVSAVVATVLIVMITVAAVAIIWATVIPMIRNSAEEGTKCYEAQTDLEILEGSYTCLNTTGSTFVQVQRGASADITAIEVHWIVAGNSVRERHNSTDDGYPEKNGLSVFENLTTASVASATTSNSYVTVAPIITVGNTETTCEPIQEVQIKACG